MKIAFGHSVSTATHFVNCYGMGLENLSNQTFTALLVKWRLRWSNYRTESS